MSRISAAAIREAAPLLLQLVRDHEAKNADAGAPASVSRDACGGTVTATSDGDAA